MDFLSEATLENNEGESLSAAVLNDRAGIIFLFTNVEDSEEKKKLDEKVKEIYNKSVAKGVDTAVVVVYDGEVNDAVKQHFKTNYENFYLMPSSDFSAILKEKYTIERSPAAVVIKNTGQVVSKSNQPEFAATDVEKLAAQPQ